ncbi:alpha/beta hydrolase [Aggregicoccus sp. 17bor-14]|uniref:alpha/beta fold hydrolase n=1 Tax=Myxococcaceae TaxID=31 RepID=UPI00129C67DA|nr:MULTISPECIES: alpha/beta hydrolase [Myxococcaceae]MBF5043045.1 alpha/beta hydrolase [Simulacricoccus sp. 17bor-14]MRI88808.1 alpha/beta hydrolase [Aggregicoccus sp. 17bor-14]
MALESFQVGEGPVATVLLHGFLGSGRNLRSLASAWSAVDPQRRFFLPDLTGHGSSPPLPEGATLETLAADVVASAREGGLTGPLHFVGHSLGGRVSLVAGARFGADVGRVDLLDITPSPIPAAMSESSGVLERLLEAPAQAPDRRTMRTALLERGLSAPLTDWLLMNLRPVDGGGVTWRFDREALARLHARVNSQDLWALVEREPHPPLRCIRGGRAGYVTDADLRRLEAAGVPVATLPEAGHFVHVDAPDALLAWLRAGD